MAKYRMLMLLLAALAPLWSQAEPSISVTADPANAAVGDTVHLDIIYRWPQSWSPLGQPDPGTALADLTLTHLAGPEHSDTGETKEVRWRASTVIETSGGWAAPRPQLLFTDPDGSQVTITAPEVLVTVGLIGTEADLAAPRGLWHPPRDLTTSPSRWWPLAVLVAALFGLGGWLWWRRHRRAQPGPDPAQIFANDVRVARGMSDGKQAGSVLSTALRRYCGARFSFDGVAATGPEVITHLDELSSEVRNKLRNLFDHLDGLLWAPEALASVTLVPLIDQAHQWVAAEEQRRAQLAAAAEQVSSKERAA